jgi:hypothetical protein
MPRKKEGRRRLAYHLVQMAEVQCPRNERICSSLPYMNIHYGPNSEVESLEGFLKYSNLCVLIMSLCVCIYGHVYDSL